MPYSSVLDMLGQRFTGLWICEGYIGCSICWDKPEYALIMSLYAWICLDDAEYD